MPDIVIPNVSESVLSELGVRAHDAGLTPAEFAYRCIEAEVRRSQSRNPTDSWACMTDAFPGLLDESVIEQAWS